MRNYIRILITLLIFQSNHLLCQDTLYILDYEPTIKSVFESYDFNSDSYTLYATSWSERVGSLANGLGSFYIRDTSALNSIKHEWQLLESLDFYDCGYDFIFYMCKENEIIEVLKLNLFCKSLTSSNGNAFEFDPDKLKVLQNKGDTLGKFIFDYSTRQEAIKSMDSLLLDSSFFIPKRNYLDWYSSEGYFMFDYSFDPKFKPELDTLIINLESEIQSIYPNDIFKIEHCGSSPWGNYLFRIYSSESLFNKFDLYEKTLDFSIYDAFSIEAYKKTTFNKK
ncbi:MAG: hypothetical protein GQ574_18155 [Crocinitomix sp.]|nr:hypothetical protein [Crocinitomix sp.]